jgi:hypothetical protein
MFQEKIGRGLLQAAADFKALKDAPALGEESRPCGGAEAAACENQSTRPQRQ